MRQSAQKIEAATALLALVLGMGLGVLFGNFLVGFGALIAAGLAALAILAIVRRQSSGGNRRAQRKRGHEHAHLGTRP